MPRRRRRLIPSTTTSDRATTVKSRSHADCDRRDLAGDGAHPWPYGTALALFRPRIGGLCEPHYGLEGASPTSWLGGARDLLFRQCFPFRDQRDCAGPARYLRWWILDRIGLEILQGILSTSVGSLLLASLFADLLLTVFHPQDHGGPMHRRLNRLFWAVLRWIGKGFGEPTRARFLALCGPLIAVTSVGTWGLWLILSFTLIYHPQRADLMSTSGGGTAWLDVFYFSGYVASTLGLGDIVPISAGLRLLTVIEAMSGSLSRRRRPAAMVRRRPGTQSAEPQGAMA